MGSGVFLSSESGEEYKSGCGREDISGELAKSVTEMPCPPSISSVKLQTQDLSTTVTKKSTPTIKSKQKSSNNKNASRNKRGGKNRKSKESESKGFSISVDYSTACTPVVPIVLPTSSIQPNSTKRTQQKKKSKSKAPVDASKRNSNSNKMIQGKPKDLFPPYDDHFTFDLFDTSIEDLLLIYSPALLTLTEQSLEDNAKEIEILESQLLKTTQEISSCAAQLHTLRQNSLSLSF